MIFGTIAVTTFHRGQESLLTFSDFSFVTVSVTTECEDSVYSGPPMPATQHAGADKATAVTVPNIW